MSLKGPQPEESVAARNGSFTSFSKDDSRTRSGAMSWNGYQVIDADSHIYERPDRTYQGYVDAEYREPYERLCQAIVAREKEGRSPALFGVREALIEPFEAGRPMGSRDTFGLTPQRGGGLPRPGGSAGAMEADGRPVPPEEANWDPAARLAAMDRAQIDVNVMFPTYVSSYCALRDVGFESALQRAWARWASDFCSQAPARLKWTLVVNTRDVAAGTKEIRDWAKDQNLVGVYLPPVGAGGKLLDSPDFYPFYQAAQHVDLPILIHIGVARPPFTPGMLDLDGRGFLIQSLSSPWAGMAALGALIGGGIFDLFPRLRVGIFETHAGWLPFALEQFEANARGPRAAAQVPHLKRSPREILASGQYFHGVESDEEGLRHALEALGDELWLFTTDFPHRGSPWPDGVEQAVEPAWLSDTTKRKLLNENARRLYTRLAG